MTDLQKAHRAIVRIHLALATREPTEAEARQVEYLARLLQRLYGLVYRHNPEAVGTAEDFGDVR